MNSLQSLLKYQDTDIKLQKITAEIERNEDNKKLEQARQEFNSAKLVVIESEKAAESIINYYNSAQSFYDENNRKIEEYAVILEKSELEDDRKELVAKLEELKNKFNELEKMLAERREKSDKIIRAYLESQEKGKKLRDIYNNIKSRLENFKKEKEPQIRELVAALATMAKEISPEQLAQYKALTAEKKFPAFVKAVLNDDKKNYRCFCGITVSQKAKGELQDKGYYQCETCRRMIYKE